MPARCLHWRACSEEKYPDTRCVVPERYKYRYRLGVLPASKRIHSLSCLECADPG